MENLTTKQLESARISIVSGEGEVLTREEYTGKRTERALKMRITKELCHGDRKARAEYLVSTSYYDGDAVENWERIVF